MMPGTRRWTERDRSQLVRRDRNEPAITQSGRHSGSDPGLVGVDCTENTVRIRLLHNNQQILNVIFIFSGVFGSIGNNAGMRTIGSPMSLVRSHLPFPHPRSLPRDPTPGPDPPAGSTRFPPSWTRFPCRQAFQVSVVRTVTRPSTRPRRSRIRSARPTSRSRRWRTLVAPCPRSHRRRARF